MVRILNPNADGLSIKNAIIIEAKTLDEGIKEEYRFLEKRFGRRGKNWQIFATAIDTKSGKLKGKIYDVLYIGFPENKKPKWKSEQKDFLSNFFMPIHFLVITPKDKYKGSAEKIRRVFKPKKVKVLLIGESSPPEKWKFFYNCNSTLYYETKKVFEEILKRKLDDDEFLDYFEKKGFYLVDLFKREDIWKRKNGKFERTEPSEQLIRKSLERLKRKIKIYKPKFIITIGIKYVSEALKKLNYKLYERIDLKLPFPKYLSKQDFKKKFKKWLREYIIP